MSDCGSGVVHFEEITSQTVCDICELSNTLTPIQRRMVADNAFSIAEAHFANSAWFRAIYAGDTPVGFIMMHFGSDLEDGIDCPGAFLWRLMIAGPHQRQGYGQAALELLMGDLRARGYTELYTSCEVGEGSPEGFYQKLGFLPTGGMYGEEIELKRGI